jgi:hypothetical protein
MKKPILLSFSLIVLSFAGRSQDVGYRTTDIGAEFQWSPDGTAYNLQFAFNARTHHSFLLRAGYNTAPAKKTDLHDGEEGNGWGGSFGYRYYTGVMPKRFYIGTRLEIRNMKIHWSVSTTESDTKLTIFQPSLEAGYTFLINDLFFITPFVAAGPQVNLKTEGPGVNYGEGFNPLAGISAGWRF